MADNTITSLCYVSDKNDKTTRLCRIADYINGHFEPYEYDTERDFYGEDRDLLIGQNYDVQANVGEIAVFDWYAYMGAGNQWWTSVKRNNEITWTETVVRIGFVSPMKLIEALKDGIKLETPFDGNHDLILVSNRDYDSGCNAVLAPKGSLRCKDDLIFLSDDVIKLPIGAIEVRYATGSCQCRYSPSDKRRYLKKPEGFSEKKQLFVKKPIEVVKDIIQGNIAYFVSGTMGRREKQQLRGVVARVTEPTIVDLVSEKLDCSVYEAQKYINQFIEEAKLKIDSQVTLSMIERLIENDSDAVAELKKTVRKEWLAENEALTAEKKKEIEKYTEDLKAAKDAAEKEKTRLQQTLQSEESKRKRLTEENEELTESVKDLKKLKEDLETEIQERLSKAKENLAGSMLDRALMMPAAQVQQPAVSEIKAPKAYTLSFRDEETETTDVYDCHDVAQIGWNRVCGDEAMASGLALLALAVFACNNSVVVAGEGAEPIADLLSVSVCGHLPLKLHINDGADADALAEEVESNNHQIICVINGLESGYSVARDLMERFHDSRFIFTAMHSESLVMEPESLFTTFFPVLTDYFFNGRYVKELPNLDCSAELLSLEDSEKEKQAYKEAKRIVGKWLKEEFFPPLLKIRIARLIASMMMLTKELGLSDSELHTAELELVLTPWLKCLRRTELLQRLLEEDSTLDSEKKKDLINYIGMGGM